MYCWRKVCQLRDLFVFLGLTLKSPPKRKIDSLLSSRVREINDDISDKESIKEASLPEVGR